MFSKMLFEQSLREAHGFTESRARTGFKITRENRTLARCG